MGNSDNDFLKPLDSIRRVDAPPFMLTAIEERIRNASTEWISLKKGWSIVITFLLLLLLNAFAIMQIRSSSSNERNIAQIFQLMPHNNLYE